MLLVPIKLCSDEVFSHAKNGIVLIKLIIVGPVGSESHILLKGGRAQHNSRLMIGVDSPCRKLVNSTVISIFTMILISSW